MTWLNEESCQACRADVPWLGQIEVREFMPQIPDWEIIEEHGINRLRREFETTDFFDAMAFAWKVGEIAEAENHHPVIVIEWGRVTVTWWTRELQGLHENDFVMAAKTDQMSTLFQG